MNLIEFKLFNSSLSSHDYISKPFPQFFLHFLIDFAVHHYQNLFLMALNQVFLKLWNVAFPKIVVAQI